MIKSYEYFLEGKNKKFPDTKVSEFNGFDIYVGRDAKSNDHLTFNMAGDDDIWLHTKGVPGSHVVIMVKNELPSKETIKYAAELAKKNSKSKNLNLADVVYCKRKFVKKEKSMNDGQVKVDYKNSEIIKV